MPIKILIVDDHDAVRKGLCSLLSSRPNLFICGQAADGLEAVRQCKSLQPDIVLMDVSMPRMDGFAASRAILAQLPSTKIIIVSQNDRTIVTAQAKEVGAAGFVAKENFSSELITTIDRVVNGTVNKHKQQTEDNPALAWINGRGEMAAIIRSTDWSNTPLGPPEPWSPTLRVMVNFLLANRFPQLLWWGPEFCCIYNDAYVPVLGTKHPSAIGRPVAEVWHEIWHILKPLIETPFHGGPATWAEDIDLALNRRGYTEEAHFTVAYSPVPDDTVASGIGGVLATVHEITEKVIGERRIIALRELGVESTEAESANDACANAANILAGHKKDVPFVVFYLMDAEGTRALAVASTGVDPSEAGCARVIDDVRSPSNSWPVSEMVQTEKIQFIQDISSKFATLPASAWAEPVSSAAIVPIRSNIAHQLAGFMIVGLSPRSQFDESYRNFLELMSTQIATSIANARAHEEERRRSEALAEIDRAKTAFFSNVSHEFRTPLTLMLGPLEELLARSHTDLSPASRAQLELVNRNGVRLLRLVNTLLDFSRIEAGRVQAVFQPTDLATFTAELASVFRSATERAGLELNIECPTLSESVYVDRDMWEKIILNLMSNAFKFTFHGSITVRLKEKGHAAELQIQDTGVGIPASEMPKLFERFHRIENTRSRTHEGSGIGLALVHELVRLHGGSMRVQSEPGIGSTFFVSVPFAKDHLPAERIGEGPTLASTTTGANPFVEEALRWLPTETSGDQSEFSPIPDLLPEPNRGRAEKETAKPRVLVVDDNADMRHYLARLLAERYDVTTAADGHHALKSIRERRPDLVLSDIMMPNLDGFALVKELRSNPATNTLPIIFLSARAGEEARVEGLDSGADDYLVKPFSAREMLARVSARLTISHLRSAADKALRESEERFRAIVETTPECVKLVAADGTLLHMNSPGLRMVGAHSADTVIGKQTYDLIAPEHRQKFRDFNERICHGERGSLEFDIISLDGQRRHMESHAAPLPNPDGTISQLAVTRDITERKKIDNALRESETRLRALVNASSYVVYSMTPDWKHMRQLGGEGFMLDIKGPSSDWLADYIPAEEQPRVQAAIRDAILTKSVFSLEHQVKRLDGTVGWTLSRAIPLFDERGDLVEWFGAASDVTARRQAEESYRKLAESLDVEVRERTKELERRNAEVLLQSEQLRDLSYRFMQTQDEERRHIARELHDSAGQTLAVLGMHLAQIAQASQTGSPEIASETQKADQLLQQLQKEIRTTSYLLHPPLLDEAGLSSALAWYVEGLKDRSGLAMELNIPENFGRFPADMELVVFRLVQECLTNIHRHSGATSASIQIDRSPGRISVEVADNGRGMSREKLLEVQSGGYGVGLRGIRERVRQFYGEMRIDSDSSGTRILVTIPLPQSEGVGSMTDSMEMKAGSARQDRHYANFD